MMELADTIQLMTSDDYKERFKAEYYQTKIRYDKLHRTLVKHDAGTLPFTLSSNAEVLRQQAAAMGSYLYLLEERAELEGIDI